MPINPFHRFVLASGLSNLADGVAVVVWPWAASLLTRDALWIALVPVALRLPWFLFALPAGIVADRVDRRRLILGMDAVRAAAFALSAFGFWLAFPLPPPSPTGISEPWVFACVLVAALGIGCAEVFRDNAAQTMLPALVPPATLERSNGLLWSVELVGNALLGPALGAVLLALALPWPFLLNAVAFGGALILVSGMHGRFRPVRTAERDWRRELGEGWAYLRGQPLLMLLAWVTGFWNLFFQMVTIALVLHAQDNLGLGPATYGLILSAGAVGGILGGMTGDRIVRTFGPGRTAQVMLASSAPAFLAMALAPGPIALAVVLAIFEYTGLVWNSVSVSYRQRAIPDALLGRVNSLYRLLAWGMMPIGSLLYGLIVSLADRMVPHGLALTLPFGVAAVGGAALTLIGWGPLGRGFRRIGAPPA